MTKQILRTAAVVVSLLAVIAPTAASARQAPAQPEYLTLARTYWGVERAPDCASESLAIDGMTSYEGQVGLGKATLPIAPNYECLMNLVPGLGISRECGLAVHEFGHWLGLGHSPDPTNVMYPEQLRKNIPAICIRADMAAHPGLSYPEAVAAVPQVIELGVTLQ